MSWLPRLIIVVIVAVTAACAPSREDRLQRGDDLFAERKWAEAAAEYEQALALDPGYGEARARLADALEKSNPGDPQRIRTERLRAAELLPDNIDVQYKAGQSLLVARRWDAVDLRADLILKKDPDSWQGRLLKAGVAAGRNDDAGAAALIEEAIRMAPKAADPYVSLGELRQRQQRRDDAEAAFRKAVELGPQVAAAHAGLGELYWAMGRTQDAERALKRATELDPGDARSQRTLARLYQTTGRLAEAEGPLKAWAAQRADVESRLELAAYYVRTNRLDDAEQVLSGAAAGEQRTQLELQLADVRFRRNDKTGAHTLVDGILAKDATNVEAQVVKARLLLYEGKLDEALARATQAVKTDPESADAHFVLGTIQAERQDLAAAIESYTRVTSLTRQSQAAQNAIIELRLRQGSPDALDQAAAMAGRSRAGAAPGLTLARALLQKGDLRRADTLLTDLLRQHDDVAAVHIQLGRLRLLQGKPAEARAEFDRALALNPRSPDAFRARVDLELREKNVAAARGLVDERLKTAGSVPDLLLSARVYDAAGDPAKAEASLRQALDLDPNHETAMRQLVRLFARQNRVEAMRLEYEAAARKDPSSIVAPTLAGLLLEEQDKRPEAQRTFEAVLAKAPAAPVAMASLARLYANGGPQKLAEAFDLAWRARLALADSPELAGTLGWIYYRQQKPELAIPQFESALGDLPNNPQLHYRLGLAHALAGNRARALASIEQALKLRPDYPQALESRADLRRGGTGIPAPRTPAGRGGRGRSEK